MIKVFPFLMFFSLLNSHAVDRTSINFIAIGDTQMGHTNTECKTSGGTTNISDTINALNFIKNGSQAKWPNVNFKEAFEEQDDIFFHRKDRRFMDPQFLILAGDVTENAGTDSNSNGCDEFSLFNNFFPASGDSTDTTKLDYPTYETTGNHDFEYVDSIAASISDQERKKITEKIKKRHESNPKLIFQSDNRGSYFWDENDIRFFNLNVKPSGGAGKSCHLDTNKAHGYGKTEGSLQTPVAVSDNKCREFKLKNGKVRTIDPNYSLGFLKSNLIENSQIVITSHYGPKSQSRLANDELQNLCSIIEEKRIRIISWIVGHTHKSDYYEWKCGNYVVPVFNVGSGVYDNSNTGNLNANEIHFSYFRIGANVLEAIDIGYKPQLNQYSIPGSSVTSETVCKNAKGHNQDWDGSGRKTPFKLIKNANFDNFKTDNTVSEFCNPDGKWGGWAVRMPVCPPNIKPYYEQGVDSEYDENDKLKRRVGCY